MGSSSTSRLIVAMVAVAALAGAFWMLALSPKRKEASELSTQVTQAREALSQHQGEAAQAEEAKRQFPHNYEQLVVLGKAAPGDDDAASLLVQLNRIAEATRVRFQTLSLSAASGETEAPPAAPAPEGSSEGLTATPASLSSPTEVAASTLPLGAAIGPAGLAVMPYDLTFKGDFFHIADFIEGLDSLVKSENEKVDVHGRLITIDGFSLSPDSGAGFPMLEASFTVTTYLTPPSQDGTAGAVPESPTPTAMPASTTTGGTP
jgi:Tfp pilus assembly protein PilO